MKTIVNKTTTITTAPEQFLTTADLIKQSLNVVPQGGFTREDFKVRDRIEAYLSDQARDFELEDADANALKKIVSEVRWTFRHPDLTDFLNEIEAL